MPARPINFKAAWSRNINPDIRAASFVGFYSREHGIPVRFGARIWFNSVAEANRWAMQMPKLVNGRVRPFHYVGRFDGDNGLGDNMTSRELGQYRLEFEMSGRLGIIGEMPRRRYERFRDAVLASGFKIDWQHDIADLRAYKTRDAFEAALAGPTIRPDPRIPD